MDGTCLFGFSRGKDTIAAFLWLRKFFHNIIPFHIASIPHLSFIDRSLAYYENELGIKIHRLVSGDTRFQAFNLVMQRLEDEEPLKKANPMYTLRTAKRYDNNDLSDVMRELYKKEHGKPMPDGGWVGFGISAYDSMFRRLRMTKKGGGLKEDAGYRESTKTFFPCYDWHPKDVMRTIEAVGLRLPDDYLLSNRTLAHIDHSQLPRLKKLFPQDFERVKAFFPFIEAYMARNEFRMMKLKQKAV